MQDTAVRPRIEPVRTRGFFWLRVLTVGIGLVATGATAQLFFHNIEICAGLPGWWLAGVFLTPLVFVGLCSWCATAASTIVEQSAWLGAAAIIMLLHIYGTAAALLTGGMLTNWC